MNLKQLLLISLVFLSLGVTSMKAQKAEIDSLRQLLSQPSEDTTRIKNIHLYVEKIIFIDLDSTLKYLKEAELLSLEIGDSVLLAVGYDLMGRAYNARGAYALAFDYTQRANALIEKHASRKMYGRSLISMGLLKHSLGDIPEAQEVFENALEILIEEKDSTRVALAYLNIGGSKSALEQEEEALGAYRKIFDYVPSDHRITPFVNNNIGYSYYSMGDYEKALTYYETALQQKKELLGGAKIGSTLQNLAETHLKLGNLKQARRYATELEQVALDNGSIPNQRGSWKAWSQYYAETGNFREAYDYELKYSKLQDSLHTAEIKDQVAQLQVAYQSERNQAQIELLDRENELLVQQNKTNEAMQDRQNLLILFLVAGVLALVTVVILLVRNNLNRKRANNLLMEKNLEINRQRESIVEQNRTLQALNQEKDGLMAVVAHDLKSPIAKTRALLGILEGSEGMPEEGKGLIGKMEEIQQSAQGLIEELVLINQVEVGEKQVELSPHRLAEILGETASQFAGAAAQKSIRLEIEAPEKDLLVNTHVNYLHRVLDNLLSNALKFSPTGSEVRVTSAITGAQIRITVRDQGPGIPLEEQPQLFRKFSRLSPRPTSGESSTGLGLYIVKTLLERLQGTIEVDSKVGKGSAFTISLPVVSPEWNKNA